MSAEIITLNPPEDPYGPPAEPNAEDVLFSRGMDGASFIFSDYAQIEPLWGTAERTLWAAGEAMMVAGPQGTGKTTLVQQVVKGRLGLTEEVLGFPVVPGEGKVLYLAMDRPRQAARSMARMFSEDEHAEALRERLVVWRGPLPFNLVGRPSMLMQMCHHFGADTLVVDSLKDLAPKLSDDEVGSVVNHAFQTCLEVGGVEVVDLHHSRKSGVGGNGPALTSADDIYGSTWLTSGHGSIVGINGKPGDLAVSVTLLKLVNEQVGPLDVVHDHDAGVSRVDARPDALAVLAAEGSLTPAAAAQRLFGSDDRNAVERARRELQRLVERGLATVDGEGRRGRGAVVTFTVSGAGRQAAPPVRDWAGGSML